MDEHSTEAYIFDPGVIARNVAGRDLAVLEVSALLHQRIDFDTFFRICSVLYSSDALGEEAVKAIRDPAGKAILSFIRGLREAALGGNDLEVYALMVFDFTLIQVGGLAFGSSGIGSRTLVLRYICWPLWRNGIKTCEGSAGTRAKLVSPDK